MPLSPDVTVCEKAVEGFSTETFAPTTGSPVGSRTAPLRLELVNWALRGRAAQRARIEIIQNRNTPAAVAKIRFNPQLAIETPLLALTSPVLTENRQKHTHRR